jgi:hypothetical protein
VEREGSVKELECLLFSNPGQLDSSPPCCSRKQYFGPHHLVLPVCLQTAWPNQRYPQETRPMFIQNPIQSCSDIKHRDQPTVRPRFTRTVQSDISSLCFRSRIKQRGETNCRLNTALSECVRRFCKVQAKFRPQMGFE